MNLEARAVFAEGLKRDSPGLGNCAPMPKRAAASPGSLPASRSPAADSAGRNGDGCSGGKWQRLNGQRMQD